MARTPRRPPDIRIGDVDREAAIATLTTALRQGRLPLAEYERRLVAVYAATRRSDLDPAVTDLPHGRQRTGPRLRVASAEREEALVRLAEALTDGRIEATEYAEAEALVRRAITYADLSAAVGDLDARASLAERTAAIEKLDAAVAEGLIEPAERAARVLAAQGAVTDDQLAALVADLTGAGVADRPAAVTDWPAAGADRPAATDRPALRRVSHADREVAAARLQTALSDGYLNLGEFDERLRDAYAAKVHADLARLLDDLPQSPPTPLMAGRPQDQPRGLAGRLAAWFSSGKAEPVPPPSPSAHSQLPHYGDYLEPYLRGHGQHDARRRPRRPKP